MFEELFDRTLELVPHHKFKFNNPLHAYDWAHYRKNKGVIKLHAELDLSGYLPCFVLMGDGKMADIRAARENVAIVPDSIYIFDKGYCDLNWFKLISDEGAFFVTRIKNNVQIEFLGRHREVSEKLGIIRDDIICFTGSQTCKRYPGKLRLVEFYDEENDKCYRFITNNFKLAASSIAGIYKQRWQIRTLFLVNQAESEDQKFSRNKQECCYDANMGYIDTSSLGHIYQISTCF